MKGTEKVKKLIVLLLCCSSALADQSAELTIKTAIEVRFPTTYGFAHMIQESTDLNEWLPTMTEWFVGNGATNSFFASSADKKYYRMSTVERPVAVGTIPANGSIDVDPSTTELVFLFPVDMARGGSTAMVAGGLSFIGPPTYPDARTIVRQVELEPNTEYILILNRDGSALEYKSTDGIPLMEYTINFRTTDGS